MRDQEILGLHEAYNQVYELDEVKGGGRIDPLSGFPNHGERARSPKDAGLKMSPIDRAEARANALRKREDPEATKRANRIQSRFIGPTKRGLSRAIDASSAAKANEKRRLTQSEDYDLTVKENNDETEEGITGQPIPKRNLGPKKRHEFEKKRTAERKKRKDPRAGDSLSINRMTGSGGHGSTYQNNRSIREEVLSYLLDEGFASDEKSAEAIMVNMSEAWIESIVEEILDEAVRGSGRSIGDRITGNDIRGVTRGNKSVYKKPKWKDDVENKVDREVQLLSDRKKKRESEMAAGRLTVATKRGIEKATNRSNDGPGGDEFAPGSALRRREEDDQPTDYRARRRRASGR
jgi:hypothetical protein